MAATPEALRAALADRYRIERELGRGGMATVYLAEDLKHRRPVAIKVLKPELAGLLGPERFLREIEIAARLQHPHILAVFDSGVAGGMLYYVMPYVEGESLRARLIRERQLPLADALRIAREVVDALSYAHSRGIVHRDIKPENVLLESGHAVVADFGIARAFTEAGGETLTATGVTLGTPAYMSPEQATGAKDVDGRSDLYSLGCVLYEMLAGQPPFTGATAESIVHQHLSAAPRPVTELRPAVPASVAVALERALAKSPADRFSPVTLFGEALSPREAQVPSATPPRASHRGPRPAWPAAAVAIAVVVVVALLAVRTARRPSAPRPAVPVPGRTEVAVLPFQNLSAGGPHAYFAGGLHDELLTQLAQVASLKVISRTSVMGYAGTTKPLRQIAGELGVGSVVEGTVQVEGDRLRVNVQLIDAATDEHLWAQRYDRTLDDAFAIQSEVAQRIVTAVGAALTSAEQGRLASAPTANPEAYRLYLQGEEYARRPGYPREAMEAAIGLYERALALDPRFALAHAALSMAHGEMHWVAYDPSPWRLERQREEAFAAVKLDPGLARAHAAMAQWHYWGRRDYRRALREYRVALAEKPNDADLWYRMGAVERRLGDWAAVDTAVQMATRLDPRDPNTMFDLAGYTCLLTRRYREAIEFEERASLLAPDLHDAVIGKGQVYLLWKGELDTLRAALAKVPAGAVAWASGGATFWRAYVCLADRDPVALLAVVRSAQERVLQAQDYYIPWGLVAAWAHDLAGDQRAARESYRSALTALDSAARVMRDDPRIHAARGQVLAALGLRVEARREAEWLRRSPVYREDALQGPGFATERAAILARIGDADAALEEVERVLARPAFLSAHTLRLEPRWDPIRDHPRFKALLAKYGAPAPV